jgi:hypothetical protein
VDLREVDFLASLQAYIGLALVAATAHEAAKALFLALAVGDLDGGDIDLEQQFDGSLDFRLGGIRGDAEDDLIVLSASIVDFSVTTGARMTCIKRSAFIPATPRVGRSPAS